MILRVQFDDNKVKLKFNFVGNRLFSSVQGRTIRTVFEQLAELHSV